MKHVSKQFMVFIGFVLYVICIVAGNSYAQNDFSNESEIIKQAEKLLTDENYIDAKPLYSQLLSLHPSDFNYIYKFGICEIYANGDKTSAVYWLEKVKDSPDIESTRFYYLGLAYHLNYKFDEAIDAYKTFLEKADKNELSKLSYSAQRKIEMCNYAKPMRYTGNDLVIKETKDVKWNEFYRAYNLREEAGKFIITPDELKSAIDLKKGESSFLFYSKERPFFTYTSYGENKAKGKDIYKVYQLPNGKWGKPENIGSVVNTDEDEDFSYLTPDGLTLYFCSKGHNSIGGYDVFKTTHEENTNEWTEPVSMGLGINSPDDDLLYVEDDNIAFFATNRQCVQNMVKIHKLDISENKAKYVSIKGKISDGSSSELSDAKINVFNSENGKEIGEFNTNKQTGEYTLILLSGKKYKMIISSNGIDLSTQFLQVPLQEESGDIFMPIYVGPSQKTDTILAKNNSLSVEKGGSFYSTELTQHGKIIDSLSMRDTKQISKNISNAELVNIAYEDAKKAQAEATDYSENASIAYYVAKKRGDAIMMQTDSIDKLEAKIKSAGIGASNEDIENLKRLKQQALQCGVEAKVALSIAKKIENEAIVTQKEAELTLSFAKELEMAAQSSSDEKAIELLDAQKKQLEELNKQREANNYSSKTIRDISDDKLIMAQEAKEKGNYLLAKDLENEASDLKQEAELISDVLSEMNTGYDKTKILAQNLDKVALNQQIETIHSKVTNYVPEKTTGELLTVNNTPKNTYEVQSSNLSSQRHESESSKFSTVNNSQPPQLTTHNSQPTTYNSQPTTHNPQLITDTLTLSQWTQKDKKIQTIVNTYQIAQQKDREYKDLIEQQKHAEAAAASMKDKDKKEKLKMMAASLKTKADSVSVESAKAHYLANKELYKVNESNLKSIAQPSSDNVNIMLANLLEDEVRFYNKKVDSLNALAATIKDIEELQSVMQEMVKYQELAIEKQKKAGLIYSQFDPKTASGQVYLSSNDVINGKIDRSAIPLYAFETSQEQNLSATPQQTTSRPQVADKVSTASANQSQSQNPKTVETSHLTTPASQPTTHTAVSGTGNPQPSIPTTSAQAPNAISPELYALLQDPKIKEILNSKEYKNYKVMALEAEITKSEAEAERNKAREWENKGNLAKSDSIKKVADNLESQSVAKENASELFLQSLDKVSYQKIMTIKNDTALDNLASKAMMQGKDVYALHEVKSSKLTTNNNADNPQPTTRNLQPTPTFNVSSNNAYSESSPIPFNIILPSGIYFKVQLGAFKDIVPQDFFKGISPIDGEKTAEGVVRYLAGMFNTFESADYAKNTIRALGFGDAFVVAYVDGKRVPLNDALAKLDELDDKDKLGIEQAGKIELEQLQKLNLPVAAASDREIKNAISARAKDITKMKGLIYTVQIGVYSNPVSLEKLYNVNPINYIKTPAGSILYSTGRFKAFNDANVRKGEMINAGIKDAFVTAYIDGSRITIAEALKIEKGDNVLSEEAAVAPETRNEPFNLENITSLKPGTDTGIVFKVQIGAYIGNVAVRKVNLFLQLNSIGVESYKDEAGYTVYTAGTFSDYNTAVTLKEKIIASGVTDAFIVAFNKGKKISVPEAIDLILGE